MLFPPHESYLNEKLGEIRERDLQSRVRRRIVRDAVGASAPPRRLSLRSAMAAVASTRVIRIPVLRHALEFVRLGGH